MLQIGSIRLATLDAVGTKLQTYTLQAPAKDGLELAFEPVTKQHLLRSGKLATRVLGYRPVLRVSWPAWDWASPTWSELLAILSGAPGTLRVSPGMTSGGFTVDTVEVDSFGVAGKWATNCSVTFTGRDLRPTRSLETF